MKQWECRDCDLAKRKPCTCAWYEDESPPAICPMGNETDCAWVLVEVPASASANSRYATALEVFNKWFTEHRGASHDTGDFYDWVRERLNAEEPHCA